MTYTPFYLPKTIKQGATTVTFGYDGDEQRIRKTTPTAETLYFGDLYERVTTVATTEHRYFIHSPERVVAVVTRGGKTPGTLYVHVDHIGSVDALTDESGDVVEERSYDAYGQRRNPVWGQPPPASFTSKTTLGFTGAESDGEFGLLNLKGRIYDPKIGRFLTMDPIVSEPLSGQCWNPYSYVAGNPLTFLDPSGFQGVPASPDELRMPEVHITAGPEFHRARHPDVGPRPGASSVGPSTTGEASSEAAAAGAEAPQTDVDTTGSWYGPDPTLPILEFPHATGPGTDDPFGIKPPGLGLGYDGPLTLLDQLLTGSPVGGRTTILSHHEPGFFTDLYIATADLEVVTLRPPFSAFPAPDPQEQAAYRAVGNGLMMAGALLTPGPQDDIALGAGAAGFAARGAVRIGGQPWRAFTPGAKACQSGCDEVAKAIQTALGGEIKVITGPGKFLGGVRNSGGKFVNPAGDLARGWRDHYVVVKDGIVFDALTGPNGMAASAYKQLWQYGDLLNFGF